MLTELFISNLASTTVTHGGMSIPVPGTIETLTVQEANGIFPTVHRGVEQFHFKDRNPLCGEEIFSCIETDGNHWTVVRGAEGSKTVSHDRKFTIRQVVTSEFLQRLGGGSTTELVNAVTVCGADRTGTTLSDEALTNALRSGPVYLPSGVYSIRTPLNLLPGETLLSYGNATIRPVRDFSGDAAISIIDGSGPDTRIENVVLDGSELGAGTSVYGIFAETRDLEAELRNIRISGFSESGAIISGYGWRLDRVSCTRNYGSGFELSVDSSLLIGCQAFGNAKYGFTGAYKDQLFGCLSRGNGIEDYR